MGSRFGVGAGSVECEDLAESRSTVVEGEGSSSEETSADVVTGVSKYVESAGSDMTGEDISRSVISTVSSLMGSKALLGI